MTERTARSVSDVLRKAGIPVGYRYTAFGYEKNGKKVTEEGCEVTRMRKARYGGMEDRGHVGVFLINPDPNFGLSPTPAFIDRVERALRDAELPYTRKSSNFEVHDDEEHMVCEVRDCPGYGTPHPPLPAEEDLEAERLLIRERLILDATEALVAIMNDDGIQRVELARRLGVNKTEITNRLNGRNMTLGTLAEMAEALGCTISIQIERR